MNLLRICCAFLFLCWQINGCTARRAEIPYNDSPKVIFDTDLDSDVDDVGALAMLLNLHRARLIELTAIIVTSDDPYAPVCAAAICRYYGFEDIPVGFLRGQPELRNHSRYTRQIAEEFPSRLASWEDAEEAVSLYRKVLAQHQGKRMNIVTVGHLTSLQRLLQSPADDICTMDGATLLRENSARWICMGGHFPEGKEANFYRPDPRSTVYCVNHWGNEVIFCGWEAGNPVITGGSWLKETLPESHPVYRGYALFNDFAGRQSWDQIAVLMLLDAGKQFFTFAEGECIVAPDGSNTWRYSTPGRHRHAAIRPSVGPDQIGRYIDRLMAGDLTALSE